MNNKINSIGFHIDLNYDNYLEIKEQRLIKKNIVYATIKSDKKNLTYLYRLCECIALTFFSIITLGLALSSRKIRNGFREVFSGGEVKHITIDLKSLDDYSLDKTPSFVNRTSYEEEQAPSLSQKIHQVNDVGTRKLSENALPPQNLPITPPKKIKIDAPIPTPSDLNTPIFSLPPKDTKEFNFIDQLNFDPSVIDFSSPANASLAFVLLNTDFLGFDTSEYPTTSDNGLAMMIGFLKANRDKLPEEAQEKIKILLEKFQCAYEMRLLHQAIVDKCKTGEQFSAAKHVFIEALADRLKKGKNLYLSSGWAGKPGHNINLELIPYQHSDGTLMVKGQIQNRGGGVDNHETFIKGTKIAFDPRLNLQGVALETLLNSQFFSHFFQLRFSTLPQEKDSTSEHTKSATECDFSENDFYNVFLPSWPGKIKFIKKSNPQIAQRGPTCAVKPLLTEMKELLGSETGQLAKFYLTKDAWEVFMKSVGVTEENVDLVAILLSKLSRRALKLKEAKLLSQDEEESTNRFCEEARKEIFEVQNAKAKDYHSQTKNLNARIQETENYSLILPEIASLPLIGETDTLENHPIPLNEVVLKNIDEFLTAQYELAEKAKNEGSLKSAQSIVLYSLRALPNPSDNAWNDFMNNKRSQYTTDRALLYIKFMSSILVEASIASDGRCIITPQQACVLVKTLGISYRLAKKTLPTELCKYYATGLKNLIENRLSPLFCPFLPSDLEGYVDAINLIYKDATNSQDASLKPSDSPNVINSFYFYYMIRSVPNKLADALKDPEFAYLHKVIQELDEEELNDLEKRGYKTDKDRIRYIYSSHIHSKSDYRTLRFSFFFTCLALDCRIKQKEGVKSTPHIGFTHSPSKKEISEKDKNVGVYFWSMKSQDKSNYHRGVFADAFPGLSFQSEGVSTEMFATDLLGKNRQANKINFNSHNTLSSFQQTEILPTEKSDSIALNPLDIQDLLATRTPDSLPLLQLEHYFTENLSKLGDPFFQSLFMTLLFKVDDKTFESPLKVALDRSPASHEIRNFFSFLKKSLKVARKTRSWTIYLFLLRAYAVSLSHCLHLQYHSQQTQQLVNDFEKELKVVGSKSSIKKMTGSERKSFDDYLIAIVPYLSDYEVMIPNIHQIHTIRASLHLTAADIAMIDDFHLQEDRQLGLFQITNIPHLMDTTDKEASAHSMLPPQIIEHDLYNALFKVNYLAKELSPGYYEFTDEKGVTYRIYANAQEGLRIFRSFVEDGETVWYAFQQDDPFRNFELDKEHPCSDEGGNLQGHARSWFKVGEEKAALVIHQQSGDLICKVTPNHIQHPQHADMTLLKNYNHPILDELSRITSKKQILAWKNSESEELSRIELKEFGLQFDREIGDGDSVKWKSSEHFGYYIDTHQKNPSFEPFPEYLILTNDEGHQLVITPSRRYDLKKIKFPNREAPKVHEDKLQQLFTYSIDSTGTVVLPQEQKALLYLIYLSLEKLDYKLCFQALEKMMRHPSVWEESMIQLMHYFETSNSDENEKLNHHPQASALRLKLKLTMLSQSSKKMDDNQKLSLKNDTINYLNQLNNVRGIQRLSLEEERALINVLADFNLSRAEGMVIEERMKYLQKKSVSFPDHFELKIGQPVKSKPVKISLLDHWDWIDSSMQEQMLAGKEKPTPINFSMRPGTSFLQNLLFYYMILQQNTPQHQVNEIQELLKSCQYDSNKRVQAVRSLLLNVLSHPNLFPPFEQLLAPSEQQEAEEKADSTILAINLKALAKKKSSAKELRSFDSSIKQKKETRIGRAGSVLKPTKAVNALATQVKFDDHPDSLLKTLLEEGIAFLSQPGDEELSKLNTQLENLRELEDFYHIESQNEDPSIAREFHRLLEGIQEVIAETEKQKMLLEEGPNDHMIIQIGDDKINDAVNRLIEIATEETIFLENAQKEIEELLHTYSPEQVLEMHGELLHPLTLEEAMIHFGRGEDEPFYRANPGLTLDELKIIKIKIGEYLIHQLNAQKRARLLNDLKKAQSIGEKKGTDSTDYSIAKAHAIDTLQANRVYTPHKAPHLLVFEAFSDICLRSEQLKALKNLTQGEANKDLIYEARTGFGKSKTLIPLWLYLTGKRRQKEEVPGLSMMTVPASLYQQQVTYLKAVLGGAFKHSVFAFQFDRTKGKDLNFLKNLNRSLDKAAAEGMCVLTTVNSLHSLLNLKIKECLSMEKSEDSQALITELRALRYKAKHQLSNFFDESRECFDIRRHYDYAIGAPNAVPRNHCQALEHVYQTVLSLDSGVSFDFLDTSGDQENHLMTEERYHNEIKQKLGEKLLEELLDQEILPDPKEIPLELLLNHFLGHYDPQIDTYLDQIPIAQKRLYKIYRDQLNIYLPRTLSRQCNGRYGLAVKKTGNRFAYPFERGVPKLSNQFATIDDFLNFTIQSNLKTPFSLEDISKFISSLKLQLNRADTPNEFKETNPDYQCYLKITASIRDWPKSIFGCGEKEILALQKELNDPKNFQRKLIFITDYILPKITVYTKKISSTPHNVVEGIERVLGASGTIEKDTLPTKLMTIEHLGAPIGSITSTWKDSQESIYITKTQTVSRLLKTAIAEHPDYNVIIDVNSTFRDLRDEREIARIVFKSTAQFDNPPIHALSYYDEEGRNLVFMRPKKGEKLANPIPRERCKVPLENIYIVMRQSSAVGADTPMPMTARALVTVGSDTQRDLFLQGLGRMRGLQKGQKVGFLIQDKDASTFEGPNNTISLQSILSVVGHNQGMQRGQDLFFNLRLLLQNLVEKEFWKYFDDENHTTDECMDLFHELEEFFVENSVQDSIDSLKQSRGIIPIEVAVKQIKEGFSRKLAPILKKVHVSKVIDIKSIFEDFDHLVDYDKLPKTIKMQTADESEGEMEIEAEIEEETEGEAEAELHSDVAGSESQVEGEKATASSLPSIPFTPATPIKSAGYRTLGLDRASSAANHFIKKFSPLLEGFYGSTNFFRMNSSGFRPKGILKTAYQYLIIREGGKFNIVLMDQQDGKAVLKEMIKDEGVFSKRDYYLMSSRGKVIAQNAQKDFDEEEWRANPQLTLLTKIFSRQFNFSKNEVDYLLSLEPDVRKTYFDFFDDEIACCWPPVAPLLTELQRRAGKVFDDRFAKAINFIKTLYRTRFKDWFVA